jgi:hypothetical protein
MLNRKESIDMEQTFTASQILQARRLLADCRMDAYRWDSPGWIAAQEVILWSLPYVQSASDARNLLIATDDSVVGTGDHGFVVASGL